MENEIMKLTKQQSLDKLMIKYPDRWEGWPMWPYLPMTRRFNNDLQCGVILDENPLYQPIDREHECFRTVYLVGYWTFVRNDATLSSYEKKVYNSVEEMLLDGWMID